MMGWLHMPGCTNQTSKNTWPGRINRIGMVLFSMSLASMIGLSGYFGITSPRLNFSRLFRTWLTAAVYVRVGFKIFLSLGWAKWTDYFWLVYHFPAMCGEYWFFSSYMILSFLGPAFHFAAKGLSRASYLTAMAALLVWEFNACRHSTVFEMHYGLSPTHLGIMYFFFGYLRLFPSNFKLIVRFLIWATLCGLEYYILTYDVGDKVARTRLMYWKCNFRGSYFERSIDTQPITTMFAISTFRLLEVLQCSEGLASAFCFMGSHTFATYIIHHHPAWYPGMFKWLFRIREMAPSPKADVFNHWRLSLVMFVFCLSVDPWREFCFATCEFGYSWLTRCIQRRSTTPLRKVPYGLIGSDPKPFLGSARSRQPSSAVNEQQ